MCANEFIIERQNCSDYYDFNSQQFIFSHFPFSECCQNTSSTCTLLGYIVERMGEAGAFALRSYKGIDVKHAWLLVGYWFNVDAKSKMIYDGRSQFQVHTDERTQVHSAQPSLAVTHPSTNRDRRALTSMN
jgi:hypothetical protein